VNDRFQTRCGRTVHLNGVHIRQFAEGIIVGKPSTVRREVLDALPATVREVFPSQAGLLIEPLPGGDDDYPTWVVICKFHCLDPVGNEADCSDLICCWFADDIVIPLRAFIIPRMASVDWEQFAVDDYY